MKRLLGLVLLALLPIIGCNQSSPTPPGPGPIPPPSGGGTTNTAPPSNGGGTVANDPTKDWYAYFASDGSYTIKFPGKPDEKSQSSTTATGPVNYVLVSYSTNLGRRAFLSSSTHYNIDPKQFDVAKGLDGARDGAAKSLNAAITNETKIDYKGIQGTEFTLSAPNGTKAKERIYCINNDKGPTLYQALVLDTDGNVTVPETDLFLTSLSFPTR